MDKLEEGKVPRKTLSDAERAQKYREKQRLLKEGNYDKNELKEMESPNLKDLFEMEEFKGKMTADDEKVLQIFLKNRKQKLKNEQAASEHLKGHDTTIQEKIQKIANYEYAELQKALTIPHTQKERRDLILGKIDENLFLFMDYMTNHEPPYSDFLKDVVDIHELIDDDIFIKLFVIVCTRYGGQDISITARMAECAIINMTSSLPNIQASYGLLRLMFHNNIALTGFPIELLSKFQLRYEQTISSFIKSITKVKRSVLELLPPSIFIFAQPLLQCLKDGAETLHRQIPLDYLPLILEIVSYSFAQSKQELDEFLSTFKKGCLDHIELLRETDFVNVLFSINSQAIDRSNLYFGTLKNATNAIAKSFELIKEQKIERFDKETSDRLVTGGQEQFMQIKQQPKVIQRHSYKGLAKAAALVVKANPHLGLKVSCLEKELTEDELAPFKLMKIFNLLELQQIALNIMTSDECPKRLVFRYQTGKGNTALSIAMAALAKKSYRHVLVINQSTDLLFRDFKKASNFFASNGARINYVCELAQAVKFEEGISFVKGDILPALLKSPIRQQIVEAFVIIDELDSFTLHPDKDILLKAAMIKDLRRVVGFTGSELQNYHLQFLEANCEATVVNMTGRGFEENLLTLDQCEVFPLKSSFKQYLIEIIGEQITKVPVVLILEEQAEQISFQLQKHHYSVFNMTAMDSASVESAMKIFNQTSQGRYPVFIINDEQGRGLDFQSCSQIEENGGIYLIVAKLPNHYLQYLQYLGRTARIGNKGRYSVIIFDKDGKNIDGSVYLSQKLEKIKNDDLMYFSTLPAGQERKEETKAEETVAQYGFPECTQSESFSEPQIDLVENSIAQTVPQNHEEQIFECEERIHESLKDGISSLDVSPHSEQRRALTLAQQREEKFSNKFQTRQSKRLNPAMRLIEQNDEAYFLSYSDPKIHIEMLSDKVRNSAYEKAIHLGCQHRIVIDVGAGSGVLSIIAANAGAQHVYAIEYTNFISQARENVKANKLMDKITLIQSKAEEAELSVERVDVIISEWMGYFLLCENMLQSVLSVRDRYLSESGIMIPASGSILLAAIRKPCAIMGVDLTSVDKASSNEAQVAICPPEWIVSQPTTILSCNFKDCLRSPMKFDQEFEIQISSSGEISGLVGWFDIEMIEGVNLTTSPYSEATHWMHTLFLFPKQLIYNEGEGCKGKIRVSPRDDNHRALFVEIVIHPTVSHKGMKRIYNLNQPNILKTPTDSQDYMERMLNQFLPHQHLACKGGMSLKQ